MIHRQAQDASDAHLLNHQLRNMVINNVIKIISQRLSLMTAYENEYQQTDCGEHDRPDHGLVSYCLY